MLDESSNYKVRKRSMKTRLSIFLITVALIAGMIGCGGGGVEYDLTIASTAGGNVTTPGEGTFTYDEGEAVDLVAVADEGYLFDEWIGDVGTIADNKNPTTTITMNDDYSITAEFAVKQYDLIISSTVGGEVTAPGEGIFNYDEGTDVDLVAVADESYQFAEWTGDVDTIADDKNPTTTITMNDNYYITADFAIKILNWYDLDAIRENLGGSYILMNDLDSTTAGYEELVSLAANEGKGWQPIGSLFSGPAHWGIPESIDSFAGSFDGQSYEIRDLFISRPDEDNVGLFGYVGEGVIENLGVVNAEVTGHDDVGGLLGGDHGGIVSNSYSTGNVAGQSNVGGLVGYHSHGLGMATVSSSYSTSSVNGGSNVGGLVGWNHYGTVTNSYSTSNVAGHDNVGGLVGANWHGAVSNSYYDYDEALINGKNIITVGALFGEDFEQWLAEEKFLDVNERLSKENGYYLISNVSDFKQLLAFGQDGLLKFRLKNDLDLGYEANFYIPYLAGKFDGNGHRISNLSLKFDSISQVGLFGYLASGGEVTQVGVENANIITDGTDAGGLVGFNDGTVSNSHSTGRVTGGWKVGGLVGTIHDGTVTNSYSTGSVTGWGDVGGLVGWHFHGILSNSYYNYDEVLINGENIITVGSLFGEDFEQWLTNDKFLDVNGRLSKENGYYVISNVSDLEQLLAFGQDDSLKFRLKNDLDLGNEANFYIPHLAGEFDGNGHKISNLSFNFDFVSQVGLFGHLTYGGKVTQVGIENTNITGDTVGGLVGWNLGTVTNSYASGSVSGSNQVGGLAGHSRGTVSDSYSTASVTGGSWTGGGLVGSNFGGTVINSYSSGSVTGIWTVGGLVGENRGTVSNSFWDTDTSGQASSAGGAGKTTAEMKNIATFTGAAWGIIAVAPGVTNLGYTWNIVDGETYPFLSWQPVS
jgi:hypothetical protein